MKYALFLSLSLMVSACKGGGDAGAPGGGKPGGPVVVRVAVARAEALPTALEFTGTLSGGEEVTVSAEVEAVVAEIVADMGDRVAAGDPLVRLNVEDLRLRAEQAEAEFQQARARLGTEPGRFVPERTAAVRRAQADLEEARRELTRGEELRRREVSAPADLESLRTRVTMAEAALQSGVEDARAAAATANARRAAAEIARKRLRDAVIRAPIAGAVSRRLVAPGEYVKIGQAVARVVVTDPLKLQGEVPERHAGAVKVGLPVTVTSEALVGQTLSGTLTRVSPEVSVSSRTFTVEARLADPEGRWKPGMFARASIQTGTTESAFAVPETAVVNQAGVSKVFVEQDTKASAREVRLVRKRGGDALVTGPLTDGERVIVSGVARLFDGAEVKVDATPAGGGPASVAPPSAGK
jgi:RND family efflux transporter MFP subunit